MYVACIFLRQIQYPTNLKYFFVDIKRGMSSQILLLRCFNKKETILESGKTIKSIDIPCSFKIINTETDINTDATDFSELNQVYGIGLYIFTNQ